MAMIFKESTGLDFDWGAVDASKPLRGVLSGINKAAVEKDIRAEAQAERDKLFAFNVAKAEVADEFALKSFNEQVLARQSGDTHNAAMLTKQTEQMRLDAEHKATVLENARLAGIQKDILAGNKLLLDTDTFEDKKKTNKVTRDAAKEELKQLKMTTEEAKEAKALANIEAKVSTSLETTSPEMLSSIVNVAEGETLAGNIANVLGMSLEEVQAMTPAMLESVRVKADSMFAVKIEQNDRALVNMVDKVTAGKAEDRELTDVSNSLDQALMDKTTVKETDLARDWAMDATKGMWNTLGNGLSNTWDGIADRVWRDDTTTKISDLEAEKNMLEKGIQNGSIKGKLYQRDGYKVPVEVDAKEYAIERLKGLNIQLDEIKAISNGKKGVALTKQVKVVNDALKELKDKKVTDNLIKKFLKDVEKAKNPKKKNKKQ